MDQEKDKEENPSVTSGTKERVVRVFISSTFRDMRGERDYLTSHVFPELRRRCRKRQVEFVGIDLRWGVTEEQTERGELLPVILKEIENCRPYFIGLLGERYGFVPGEVERELSELQPWLKEHSEKSITELEIIHGVLRSREMAGRSFFYFRDPGYIETLPPERQADFRAEDPAKAEKLRRMKDEIRKSNVPVREDYPDPEAACNLILEDLWAAIDAEFPEGTEPGPLDREAMDHEAFARERAKVYIGRDEYFEELDKHVNSDARPL